MIFAVQAAPGPAGRVEPTCSFQVALKSLCAAGVAGRRRLHARRSPMKRLPDRVNLDHLKKQAKDLIRLYRSRDAQAIARFRHALPAAADHSDDEIASLKFRLHDAQSCVAREYGFASWSDLRRYVEVQSASHSDRAARTLHWLRLVYPGEVAGTVNRAAPRVAVRVLAENPDLIASGPHVACAIGD